MTTAALQHRRWPGAAIALVAVGAVLRIVYLAVSWNGPPGPDLTGYLRLARRYSFAHPWSASYREPLWRALLKVATGPFGYSVHSARTFTTLTSIVTLPVAWVLFRKLVGSRNVSDRAALIALAVLALSAALVRQATQGIREELTTLLFLVFIVTLLEGRMSRARRVAGTVVPIALLSVIRWELSLFAATLTVLWALARRSSWLVPVLAFLSIAIVSGPWLLANRQRHGALFYNTATVSTWYWKQEQPKKIRNRYTVTAYGLDPPTHLTWSTYYLDYLGPLRSIKRFAIGYPKLVAKLVVAQAVPQGLVSATIGVKQTTRAWKVAFVALGVLLLGIAAWIVHRLRDTRLPDLLWDALAVLALAIAPYAALEGVYFEVRVLVFAIPVLALVVGILADAIAGSSRPVPHAAV